MNTIVKIIDKIVFKVKYLKKRFFFHIFFTLFAIQKIGAPSRGGGGEGQKINCCPINLLMLINCLLIFDKTLLACFRSQIRLTIHQSDSFKYPIPRRRQINNLLPKTKKDIRHPREYKYEGSLRHACIHPVIHSISHTVNYNLVTSQLNSQCTLPVPPEVSSFLKSI